MKLPTNYKILSQPQRREVREEYARLQKGRCKHCGEPLGSEPSTKVRRAKINLKLFPPNFLSYPIHLHHCHNSGMTIGAVHARCNAYLWQYLGE